MLKEPEECVTTGFYFSDFGKNIKDILFLFSFGFNWQFSSLLSSSTLFWINKVSHTCWWHVVYKYRTTSDV